MPYLRWVVIGFSQQRPGFIHRVVPKEYVVKNMIPVLEQVYLQIHLFPVNYHSTKVSLSSPWGVKKKKNLKKTSPRPPSCSFTFYKNITSTKAFIPTRSIITHTHTHTKAYQHTHAHEFM
jgi:hypothetical protein